MLDVPVTSWPGSSTPTTRSSPDAIPNDSDDFDERIHDYVAVCRRIDERELPSAYERMRRLITEQAPGAILGLHMAADAEERRIVEQIERVNTGLGAVAFNRGTRLRLVPGRKKLAAVEELTEKARQISNRATAVSFGDEQAILEQYSDILLLRERLAGNTPPEDRQWTRDALDVRNRFDFYCEEHDAESGETIRTYSNAGDNSGGEQEKLMAFCLAGALSFNLASPHGNDNRPIFAQLMLDEAFSKSDPQFAQQALSAFRKFGFQLIIVATVQNTSTIQPYVDNVVMVSKTEVGPELRPVATATSTTIKAFSELRRSGESVVGVEGIRDGRRHSLGGALARRSVSEVPDCDGVALRVPKDSRLLRVWRGALVLDRGCSAERSRLRADRNCVRYSVIPPPFEIVEFRDTADAEERRTTLEG